MIIMPHTMPCLILAGILHHFPIFKQIGNYDQVVRAPLELSSGLGTLRLPLASLSNNNAFQLQDADGNNQGDIYIGRVGGSQVNIFIEHSSPSIDEIIYVSSNAARNGTLSTAVWNNLLAGGLTFVVNAVNPMIDSGDPAPRPFPVITIDSSSPGYAVTRNAGQIRTNDTSQPHINDLTDGTTVDYQLGQKQNLLKLSDGPPTGWMNGTAIAPLIPTDRRVAKITILYGNNDEMATSNTSNQTTITYFN